jgi:putative transposase
MITAHQYKLRPNKEQASQFDDWLSLLRMQYNWRRAERFNWFEFNRSPVNSCSLVSCSIAPIVKQPDYYWQKKDLLNTKKLFPEYAGIHSQVLLNCIERVKKAFDRYIKAGSSGKLRFKGRGRSHSFTYTQMKQDCIKGNRITLPKIGEVKIILHRPIPDGFKIKTATIVFAADGYYVSLTLQDESVPVISPDFYAEKVVGIDMGLKEFLNTSEADTVPIPQFARKAGQVKKRLNKSVSRKKKGSNRRGKAVKRLSRHDRKVAGQGKDFHYKTAKQLLDRYDLIGLEDLKVKGWAKTRFAKSILDAGWSEFLALVACKAQSAGKMTIAVHPNGTTQNGSSWGTRIPKTMANRWHSCHLCGLELGRDVNAAINVNNFAVGRTVIKASLCVSCADAGLAQKSTLYSSTS